MGKYLLNNKVIDGLKSTKDLREFLESKNHEFAKELQRIDRELAYRARLEELQVELLQLQNWVRKHNERVVIVFEGRDAAGKGGAIKRFTRYLNPRNARVVALGKPTDIQRQEWYFRRYVAELPHPGEIVFFDRSWYNRAVVEPVMGFCTDEEYDQFMKQVPAFEHMLHEDGVKLTKLWFDVTKKEQVKRFDSRQINPLKQWKISPVDMKSVDKWNDYDYYIQEMFSKTHTDFAPWTIIRTDAKKLARLECIRYVLSKFPYREKKEARAHLLHDPNVVHRYHRSVFHKDSKF